MTQSTSLFFSLLFFFFSFFFSSSVLADGVRVKQPKLPYARNALEPYISTETLSYHYDKHHLGYYTKLEYLIQEHPAYKNASLETIIKTSNGVIKHQAAQTYNHAFYWRSMRGATPARINGELEGPPMPSGAIQNLIDRDFGSFSNFQYIFNKTAVNHFGSGYVWLVAGPNGRLQLLDAHDATSPLNPDKGRPILCCDLWEHAYYVDYRNSRASYLDQWWNLVDWNWANRMLLHLYEYDAFN